MLSLILVLYTAILPLQICSGLSRMIYKLICDPEIKFLLHRQTSSHHVETLLCLDSWLTRLRCFMRRGLLIEETYSSNAVSKTLGLRHQRGSNLDEIRKLQHKTLVSALRPTVTRSTHSFFPNLHHRSSDDSSFAI